MTKNEEKTYWEGVVGHSITPQDPKISEDLRYKIEHQIYPSYITETPEMLGYSVTNQGCNVNYPEDPNHD